MKSLNRFFAVALLLAVSASVSLAADVRVIDDRIYHLRSGGHSEWTHFQNKIPDDRKLEIRFAAQANDREATLFIQQDDVKLDWGVELNGRKIGKLFLMESPLVHALAVPGGGLRDGENTLSITPPGANDDILVGRIRLDSRPLQDAISQATFEVQVTDGDSGEVLPCRITIADSDGSLAPLYASPGQRLAVRPGVVYTGDGKARLGLRAGTYTIYATRGFEYGLDSQKISISMGQTRPIQLSIRREVPTTGLASSDTHVHTLTHSGHGDATIEERALTLAGEGIDLPIATDHEYLADFSGPAARMGVTNYFTPVIGCETTTAKGHFNSFPIVAGSRVPDLRITQWPQLMQSIRATPGVQVVILNHPRNVHSNFQPFAATNFNAVTGENLRGPEFTFDAIEVANSSALQSDWMLNFRDWFALLNYGYRVTAVGSSDGHDVSRYIVGQGRSYVSCDDSKPGKINVEAACQNFLRGRVLVSLGLLTKIAVDERFLVGELATGLGDQMRVTITVLGPSWINADRVELYANGVKIRQQQIAPPALEAASKDKKYDPLKAKVIWTVPKPKHDVHLIALASGPGVTGLYWPIARPYQPSSPVWEPRVVGCTNPIWVDADGDGKFSSPRNHAQVLIQRHGTDPRKLLPALALCDEAVAAQAASLCQSDGQDVRRPEFMKLLADSPEAVQRGFQKFADTIR
jgi:hypothetical protein